MSRLHPFYESREDFYDCHSWKHPNFPIHLHKHLEFVSVTEGMVTITVSGLAYTMYPGDCALIYPNQLHSYASTGEIGMLLIIVDMDHMGEFEKEMNYYELSNPVFPKARLSKYGQKVLDILQLSDKDERIPYRQNKGLFMALLSDIFRSIPIIAKDKPADLNITQKLLLYINANITKDLSAGSVAKALGISPYYLSHVFSSQLKISFPAYVAQQRLILACDLLKGTQKSITEITYEAGFPNMRTFHRYFQQKYGSTPMQWRKEQ